MWSSMWPQPQQPSPALRESSRGGCQVTNQEQTMVLRKASQNQWYPISVSKMSLPLNYDSSRRIRLWHVCTKATSVTQLECRVDIRQAGQEKWLQCLTGYTEVSNIRGQVPRTRESVRLQRNNPGWVLEAETCGARKTRRKL